MDWEYLLEDVEESFSTASLAMKISDLEELLKDHTADLMATVDFMAKITRSFISVKPFSESHIDGYWNISNSEIVSIFPQIATCRIRPNNSYYNESNIPEASSGISSGIAIIFSIYRSQIIGNKIIPAYLSLSIEISREKEHKGFAELFKEHRSQIRWLFQKLKPEFDSSWCDYSKKSQRMLYIDKYLKEPYNEQDSFNIEINYKSPISAEQVARDFTGFVVLFCGILFYVDGVSIKAMNQFNKLFSTLYLLRET
ncbi:MAG: hypothetical protein GY795_22420 [Desulfobacterales bacterium]|nr:hypothetical protein [Desulfobacterales bacterium]